MKLPNWYYKCTRENPEPLIAKGNESRIAQPHEVCIKNYIPEVTPEQYKEMARLSAERNK